VRNVNSEDAWREMSTLAWEVRSRAFIHGKTRVGCAALTLSGKIYVGCNIEHRFRCHDIHAETNAISAMISAGEQQLVAILIVAERKKFTPCGGCLDWIFQFGGNECEVAYQTSPQMRIFKYSAKELMPHYPE